MPVMNFFHQPIVYCILGAVAVQLLSIIDACRHSANERPDYRSLRFYVKFLASVLVAAIVGYIYFENADAYDRIVYFHTGASAPLLIRSLSASMPLVVKPKE